MPEPESPKDRVYSYLATNPRAKLKEIIGAVGISKPTAIIHRRNWLKENPEAMAPQDEPDAPEGEEPAPTAAARNPPKGGPEPSALQDAFPPAEAEPPADRKPTEEQVAAAKSRTVYLRL